MNQALPPSVRVRRTGPPRAVKWFFVSICFLMGPGLLAFGGWELNRRSNELTETAAATIVEVKIRDGARSKLKCAVVEWEHEGQVRRAELPDCESGFGSPQIGARVDIRYSPADLQFPYPDDWMGTYGEMVIPLGIAGGLFTALFVFLIVPRCKRA